MREKIHQFCMELGFDAVGITTAEPVDAAHADYFRQWLDDGCAGEMAYLRRNIEKRFDPAKLLAGAKSVICVALNYRPVTNNGLEARSTLRIARFAQYEDYHPFMKDRLFQLAEFIGNAGVSPANVTPASEPRCDRDGRVPRFKACVDSVPLAERALAQRAGLGFIGKNHMLIHPEQGSQILLGELITTLELEPDKPLETQSCGDCGRCLRACPTGALAPDGAFDARKCISYQTIEAPTTAERREPPDGSADNATILRNSHRGACAPALLFTETRDGRVPNYIFGCDECILACPHELNAPPRRNMDFQHHPEWQDLTPAQILNMTEADFQTTFANSGLLRLGLDRLKRNCAYLNRNPNVSNPSTGEL